MNKKNNWFPSQKRSTSAKGEKFLKECVDAGIGLTDRDTEDGVRTSRLNKQINKDLANGIVDVVDMYKITNPFKIDGFDRELQSYPLARPRINLLVGEESLRTFEPQAAVINDDAVNEKEEEYKAVLLGKLKEAVMGMGYKEDELKAKLAEIDKWMVYDYQDMRERMSNQLMAYYRETLRLDLLFNDGFEDAVIESEEIYCVDVVNGELEVRKIDPLNIYTLRQEAGNRIDDADVIVEDGYHSVGYVIDHFYDELTEAQIKSIEEDAYEMSTPSKASVVRYSEYDDNLSILDAYVDVNISGYNQDLTKPRSAKVRAFSEDGRVRVSRVVWRSLRKIGVLTVIDEDGSINKAYVDENYPVDKELGEEVKWIWINEWWEGTKIGSDIYVKMQPRPIQYRRMTNKSVSGSGYIGTSYGISIMDLIRPYQYLYDEFMDRIKSAFKKFKGPMIELDFAKMPDEWEPEKWIHYAENMGYLVIDSFKAGDEGAAQGTLAGNFNTSNKAINPNMGDYIQQHIMMLEYIERQVGIITGLNQQRMGQISSSETVGGVERAVRQSNHMTEKLFKAHDNTKLRVMESVLETARYILKKDKKKMQYLLDDMTSKFIEVDGQMLSTVDLGLKINDATEDANLLQDLKGLAQAGLQNNKINYTQLIDIYTSKGIASMRRKLELAEREADQREQAAQQAQQEAAKAQAEAAQAAQEAELMQKERESIRDAETKLAVEEMKLGAAQASNNVKTALDLAKAENEKSKAALDEKKINSDIENNNRKINLDKEKQRETERSNRAKEAIARQKPKTNTSK